MNLTSGYTRRRVSYVLFSEKTAKSSPAKHHIGAFTRLLSEEASDASIEMVEQEMALAKAVDAMVHSIRSSLSIDAKKEKHQEYENECREKYAVPEVKSKSVDKDKVKEESDAAAERKSLEAGVVIRDGSNRPEVVEDDKSDKSVDERKINVLYELLSACLPEKYQELKKCTRRTKGYDARHRVALRLLATWFNVEWIKVKAVETMVACSAMVLQKSRQLKNEDAASSSSTWAKWKRGGIIGAAALTGGTLWPSLVVRQIQPRILFWLPNFISIVVFNRIGCSSYCRRFGALARTLGTLVPVIGAGGFAAAASAAGTFAGLVAVAASFGAAGAGLTGAKMARRIGDLEEFEFKANGENHNQGRLAVEVLVAGVVFEEEDFVKPWQGLSSSLERTLGADHFFVTCHDVGVRAFEGSPLLLKNTIRVVCSPSYNVGFIPHKDVALPQVLQPFALPAGGNDVENRTTLGFWAGHRNSKIHVILARV
ncbi:hypothetical protein Bca52824_006482 [Brassica carinata]|uniref:Uncharacterized protein n=1 Tax=Brassica carinata TaxID=52824 RepID=A0A8X8B4J4_BRACI|nr:hypothetical protein Bca52824_006482 [Brassica carinata]